jgi:hypothetical protein
VVSLSCGRLLDVEPREDVDEVERLRVAVPDMEAGMLNTMLKYG